MYVIIDHLDSFTHNLAQMLGEIVGTDRVKTLRINTPEASAEALERLPLSGLIFSPGPGNPGEYPESVELIRHFAGKTPILGVCLGHELLAAAFGGGITRARRVMHGKVDELLIDGRGLFRNIPSPSTFMRYHSLVAAAPLPPVLEATAWSRDGDVMGFRHRELPVEGVQFHPESIGSESGRKVLENFANYRRNPFPAPALLSRVVSGRDLDFDEARAFMTELADGNLSDAQVAGFLCALEAKGPTADEIAGCVSVLRDRCVRLAPAASALDIVGVGGDGRNSFNLSSMAALAAAACGQVVAKHGNRAASSFCGSADFFEELGFPLDLRVGEAETLLRETGFVFLFAPPHHAAMRHAAKARRSIAIRTPMNLLGPLANPADAGFRLVGVPESRLLEPMATAAMRLGIERILTICSDDGFDEISCAAPTRCHLAAQGEPAQRFVFDPKTLGISPCGPEVLRGGTAEDNVKIARRLLSGEERGGLLDAVCLNAGAGLWVSGREATLEDGYRRVKEAFGSGEVARHTERLLATAKERRAARG